MRYEERKKFFFYVTEYVIFESLQTKSSFHRENMCVCVWERESKRLWEEKTLYVSLCVSQSHFFNVVVSDKPLITLTNPHPSKKFTQGKLGCFIATASTDREEALLSSARTDLSSLSLTRFQIPKFTCDWMATADMITIYSFVNGN